jgi:malonyl CoA-acyl carrier protein transacylase
MSPNTSWIFPGQGSQSVGMGAAALAASPAARAVLAEAEAALGEPLGQLMATGPAEALERTEVAQPAILTISIAMLAAARERAAAAGTPLDEPILIAGHSAGQYAAAVAAGALSVADGVRLARRRGELMQASGGGRPGAMAAILGLPESAEADVIAAGAQLGILVFANRNSPGQIVLSGEVAAIEAAVAGAACLRINPGNIGDAKRVAEVVKAAKDYGCSIRIGVNAGSLEKHLLDKYGEPCPDAMVESGMDHIKLLQDNDFHEFKISVKASDVFMAAAAYQQLASVTDAPIHLGITEAGGLTSGTVKSAIGLGNLLWSGIGDTIRVSLSADPVEEVKVGFEILKSLGLRHRGVTIISCPSCARQGFDVIKTVSALEDRLAHITTSLSLSISTACASTFFMILLSNSKSYS